MTATRLRCPQSHRVLSLTPVHAERGEAAADVVLLFQDLVDSALIDPEGLGDVVLALAQHVPLPHLDRVVEGELRAAAAEWVWLVYLLSMRHREMLPLAGIGNAAFAALPIIPTCYSSRRVSIRPPSTRRRSEPAWRRLPSA